MPKFNQNQLKSGGQKETSGTIEKKSGFEDIFNEYIDSVIGNEEQIVDIITFAESRFYLNVRTIHPVQKFILKAFYKLPFDDSDKTIWVRSFPHDEKGRYLTEVEYLKYLQKQERTNLYPDGGSVISQELILACGRRSGKTFLASIMSAYEAYKLIVLDNPQAHYKMAEDEQIRISNIASSGEQALVLARAINNRVMNCDWFLPYIASFNDQEINFRTKRDIQKMKKEEEQYGKPLKDRATVRVEALLSSARSIRGGSVILAVLDEIAHFVDNSGNRGGKAIYDSLRPSLATFARDGKIICISSPGPRSGIFYDLYIQSKNDYSVVMMQMPTWEVNPSVDFEFLRGEYRKDPEVFDQEYGAKFTTTVTGYLKFPEKLIECVSVLRWEESFDTDGNKQRTPIYREETQFQSGKHRYYVALDPALSSNGYTLCMGHLERDENMKPVVVVDKWKKWDIDDPEFEDYDFIDLEYIDSYVMSLTKQFNIAMIAYDQFESGASIQKFIKAGLNAKKTTFTKSYNMEIYKNLRTLIYNKQISVLYNEEGISEVINLQEKKTDKRHFKVQAPTSGDVTTDDMADVLANMAYCVLQHELNGSQITSASGMTGGNNSSISAAMESRRDYFARKQQHKYIDKFAQARRLNSFSSIRRGRGTSGF